MMNGQTETIEGATPEATVALIAPSLPINVKELVRFPSPTVPEVEYFLRHWTPSMRNRLGEEMTAAAVPVSTEEMDEATRDAIGEVLAGDAQAAALELLAERDGMRAAVESGEEIADEKRAAIDARLGKLERVLRRGSEAYRAMIADRQRWNNAFALWAVRLTLRRWTGPLPASCELARGLVTDDALAALPPDDLRPLANQAAAMMSLSEQHRKN